MWIGRYIAGNNIHQAINISKQHLNRNKLPIINYAVENTSNAQDVFMEHINLIDQIDYKYKIAIKFSSFNFDDTLIDHIIRKSIKKNIRVIIDAEDGKLNEPYQEMCKYLIQRHNRYSPILVKTYQMYRKDALNTLEKDLIETKQANVFLGIKLVRGAYHQNEKKDGYLFTDKKDTDYSYNNALLSISKNYNNNYIMLATHNNESMRLGYLINKHFQKNIFEFGHLMGMNEIEYQRLADSGSLVNTYIPYGPYTQMIPYLSRRMYENMHMIKYMVK